MVKLFVPNEGSLPTPLNFLMLLDGQMRQWMYCWKFELTTVGTLMVTESYRAVVRFHPVHIIERKVQEEINKSSGNILARLFMARGGGPVCREVIFFSKALGN